MYRHEITEIAPHTWCLSEFRLVNAFLIEGEEKAALVDTGCATPAYAQRIIECVEEFGPYIVIVPGLAIPHSTKGSPGVSQTAISFVRFEQPVIFDPEDREKDARVFFALAAVDEDAHIKNYAPALQDPLQ